MSLLIRSSALKRTSRTLLKCLSKKNYEKLIYRTYFTDRGRFKSSDTQLKKSGPFAYTRDLNFALLSGGVLVLSYSYFSSKQVVSLDTVKGLKHYSTDASGSAPSKAADSSSSDSSSGSNTGDSLVLLTEQEVNNKLRDRQKSFVVNRGKGIVRYDVSQLPSNHPIEDNHTEQVITVPDPSTDGQQEDLYFFGIFDGHSGSFTSTKLSQDLVRYVAQRLGKFYEEGVRILASSSKMDSAILQAFEQLDDDIVFGSLRKLFREPTKENMIGCLPAISGSCALLAAYNSFDSTVKVAVTGDSRALIAGLDKSGEWVVRSLSTDQTGDNPEEVQRIRSEHPGEPNAIRNGRVLGSLQPSRAFGDYRYKVDGVDGKTLADLPEHVRIYFRARPRDFLTPPYVTARPEITTTKIDPETKFMVLGSDGLFELLSNEEIAGLVVKWMKHSNSLKSPAALESDKLPKVTDLSPNKESLRPAFRYKSRKDSEHYLMEDKNVATHLIRNALSAGGSKEYVSTLVSIPSPMSRKYRDDLTVTVVFFGEQTDKEHADGSIQSNFDATTQTKPKL